MTVVVVELVASSAGDTSRGGRVASMMVTLIMVVVMVVRMVLETLKKGGWQRSVFCVTRVVVNRVPEGARWDPSQSLQIALYACVH